MNLSQAIQCAEAIAAMYRGDLKPTINEPSTDTQVRIEQAHSGECVVILPGTDSARDWRTDAKILKTEWWEDAMAHRGFVEAFRSVGSQIVGDLFAKQAERVIITGHSLGGALATLCADACVDAGLDVASVYTFGSPRVGNRTFARNYNEELEDVTFRIVNARDPVPWLPFPVWSPRTGIYTHVGGLVYLPHDGGIEMDSLLPHFADALATMRDQAQEQKFFGDVLTARTHNINQYLLKLKALA